MAAPADQVYVVVMSRGERRRGDGSARRVAAFPSLISRPRSFVPASLLAQDGRVSVAEMLQQLPAKRG
jgi:hypothetical protein